jgi:hypothetical protein
MSSVSRPEFDVEEAVARFFPRSTGYDRVAAKRFIGWLDRCGYAIVAKDALKTQPPRRETPKPASAKSEEAARAALETTA